MRIAPAVALVGVLTVAPLSLAGHDRGWDWKGNSRTINISFDISADATFVNRVPGFEPDPTIGDAFSALGNKCNVSESVVARASMS